MFLASLAYLFLGGIVMGRLSEKGGLPRIIGLLFTGIIIGPYALNLLDDSLLAISADLRQIALIIILLKAGLTLNIDDLKKVGRPAVLMSFIPATFEIIGYYLLAPALLGISKVDALIMGSVIAAVSPAVVIPRMVYLMENGYGTKQSIPQLIMAGASCDDIFVIVLFSTFTNMALGGSVSVASFLSIPSSIILGVIIGCVVGYGISILFNHLDTAAFNTTLKVIVILGVSFLLICLQEWAEAYVSLSGLLAVVAMGCMIKVKCDNNSVTQFTSLFSKLWIGAEIILFVLVGAAVDIRYSLQAGVNVIILILAALIFRAAGVFVCLLKTKLSKKERLFCILAYIPKATVQAAIGGNALAMGLSCGQIVLTTAVVAILITAPLGAFLIDSTYKKLISN